jgi:hypothetical protein
MWRVGKVELCAEEEVKIAGRGKETGPWAGSLVAWETQEPVCQRRDESLTKHLTAITCLSIQSQKPDSGAIHQLHLIAPKHLAHLRHLLHIIPAA